MSRLPPLRAGRALKRWRYVGLYGEELMLCVARVRIGPLPQGFWAVWDRSAAEPRLRERTLFRPGGVRVGREALRAGPVDVRLSPDGAPLVVASEHDGAPIWTRKQPVRARGTVGGRPVDLRGLLDDSAGYHARHTAWEWCAGVGERAGDAHPVAWNLVRGLHDAAAGSERAVWIDGAPHETPPVAFAADLSAVTCADTDGGTLRFAEEARRARADDLGLIASDYVQPFGTFSGQLPDGTRLARGWGVMERHDVRW
jgi:hypothetical protein